MWVFVLLLPIILFLFFKNKNDLRQPHFFIILLFILLTISRLGYIYYYPEYFVNIRYLSGLKLKNEIINTILILLLGIYSFFISFLLNTHRFKFPKLNPNLNRLKKMINLITIGVMAIIFFFIKVYLSFGSVFLLILNLRMGEVDNIYIIKQIIILFFVLNFYLLNLIREVRLTFFSKKIILLQIIISLFFLLLGDRNLFIFVLFSFLFLKPVNLTFKNSIKFIVVFAMIISIGYSLKVIRNSIFDGTNEVELEESFNGQQFFNAVNGQNIDNFVLLQKDYRPFNKKLFGLHFLYGTFGLIPRAVWSGKPVFITSGQWFREKYYPSSIGGKPITAFGEQFVNFGLLGIVFFCGLSGWLFKLLWNSYLSSRAQNAMPITIIFFGLIKFTAYGFIGANILFDLISLIVPLILFNKYIND